MLFIPILVVAIVLYMCGQRVISLLMFFFFLFNGFQIVPEEMFETAFGFSKPLDFAFFYVISLFVWGCFFYHDYIPMNKMTLLISVYLSMILCLIVISKFILGIGWGEIIRTSRYFFLILSYFVLRRCTRTEIDFVLKVLLVIVFFQCILFILQAFTGIALLTGAEDSNKSGQLITRFYNLPKMIYFLLFYIIFAKPIKGSLWYVISGVMLVTIFLPMHRSMSMVVILALLLGVFLNMKNIKQLIRYIPYFLIVFIPLTVVFLAQMSSKTLADLQSVQKGEFIEVEDVELDSESTFLFRMAHFYERFQFAQDKPLYRYFGFGLMTEDAAYTSKKFDFVIGLDNEETGAVSQLDTSDISWSLFVVRYGFVGTLVYLSIFFILCYHFFKHRKIDYALSSMLYLLFVFGCSLTSDMLFHVYMLIFPMLMYDFTIDKKEEVIV